VVSGETKVVGLAEMACAGSVPLTTARIAANFFDDFKMSILELEERRRRNRNQK
jgi:hypothetical protein